MLPIVDILLQAGRLIRRQPYLILPVFVGAIAARILLGTDASSVPQTIAFWLLNLALTAGFLSMIRAAHLREDSIWNAFLVGVGRYFAPLLSGSVAQFGLMLLTLLPIVLWLRNSVGVPDLKPILEGAKMSGSSVESFISKLSPREVEALSQWVAALGVWAAVWGIFFFFLSLWQQALVANASSWPKAWHASISFVRRHWLSVSGLLLLQCIAVIGAFGLVALQVRVVAEIGALCLMVINCYFAVVLTVAFIGPPPEQAVVENGPHTPAVSG